MQSHHKCHYEAAMEDKRAPRLSSASPRGWKHPIQRPGGPHGVLQAPTSVAAGQQPMNVLTDLAGLPESS